MHPSVQINPVQAFSCYPDQDEIDRWVSELIKRAASTPVTGEELEVSPVTQSFGNNPNTLENRFICFHTDDHNFYGYWQPAPKAPSPLIVNLPGYGGFISNHPQICDDGYHILHISPLGYVTPFGMNHDCLMEDGNWPVLDFTARGMKDGYEDWLLDCLLAIRWARAQPCVISDRISLFGTSQGGGASLLLASILQDSIRCVCADLPFLTAFPLSELKGDAYGILQNSFLETDSATFWRNLGYIDTLSHAHRLHIPVMLSAGGKDNVCPVRCVEELFRRLSTTKQYSYLQDTTHTHSRESMFLFRSWLALFA